MIKVKASKYAKFEYTPYLERGAPTEKPKDSTYEVGHVVYLKHTNTIGVILGCIDEFFDGAVRTDTDGMVCLSDIRAATIKDFDIKDVRFQASLFEDIKEMSKPKIKISLRDLAAVSNNSQVTNKVLSSLNDKLSDEERREFKKWLQIVAELNRVAVNKAKKKVRF